ncbi:MAG: DUF3344 domain-containing protein [Methanoregula sp.]|jgi:PKD repeat protein|nr:DUF3344 domain-containing protein [Methanoregula sp.]
MNQNTHGYLEENSCLSVHSVLAVIIVFLLLLVVVPVSADDFVGGLPLTTVQTGTVSGDLWFDATPAPDWGSQSVVKTFTLPAAAIAGTGRIRWARLYVSAYCGHMQDDKAFTITNKWDGNGDGTYEQVWPETGHAAFTYIYDALTGDTVGNDNTALGGGLHDPYKMINNHENRVTSDYFMWYDVTSMINGQTIKVNIDTTGSYDGRIKLITLVVAYDDPSSTTQTKYWVNQGHDACSYYTEDNFGTVAMGSTTFATTGLSGITSATLTVDYLASNNGYYGFPTAANNFNADTKTGGFTNLPLDRVADVQGAYSGVDHWDVKSSVTGSSDTTFAFARYLPGTGIAAFFKTPLVFLKVRYGSASGPVAGFTATPLSGTAPLTVSFTDQSTNTPTSWKWEYKTGTGSWTEFGSGARNPSNTFAAGTYDIRLTVSNSDGTGTETKAGCIAVNAATLPPVAAFSAAPTSGTAPLSVTFTDQSTGSVTSRTWDFDNDGNTDSTAQNPVFTYATTGLYTVNMTVTGPGGSDSERKTGYIAVMSPPPVAAFTATPRSGSPPLAVTFTDQSTNTPTSWVWFYKNASVDWTSFATTKNPSYSFVTGTYDIRLNATNNGGSDADIKTGYITVNTTPIPLLADFSTDHTLGSVPLTVRFSDTSTGIITSWAWDFNGDGSIDSTDQDPVYTYTTIGSYAVNLTVAGPGGADTTIKTSYITVTAVPPVAAFTATPRSGRPPLAVLFNDTSSGSIASWAWDFTNDGTIDSTTKNTTYTYNTTGIYIANLTVTGPGGISSTTDTITVSQTGVPPDANFTADVIKGNVPLSVKFRDKSEGTVTSWVWDFNNDGINESAEQNPTYIFSESGVYTVTLTVSGPAGSDAEKKIDYIRVRGTPDCDLAIGGAINPVASTVFAKEPNTIRIVNVKNNGPGTSLATSIQLKASDGFTIKDQVPALTSGQNITLFVTDTTVRSSAGGTVTYNVTIDPEDDVAETNEENNVKNSPAKTVTYNGYKGRRYWDGRDITTTSIFDINGGLVHSFGDSAYHSGSFGGSGWTSYKVTWTSSDLPVPTNATITKAVLYVPYTWDNSNEIDTVSLSFNGNSIPKGSWYHDVSNFGAYADHVYGLLTYDVTSSFRNNTQNTATFSRSSSNAKLSMYGFTLAVIYEDPSLTRKQIFINEGFDLLGADETGYATTPEEATAYIPFTRMTIDPAAMSRADLITFVASGDNEGILLLNNESIGTSVWDFGSMSGPQVAVATRDVTGSLKKTGNIFAIQSTPGETPCMGAMQQFLIVEYGNVTVNRTLAALTADFSAEPLNGTAPLRVNFTDLSTGNPISWEWDFDNDGTIDNATQHPQYIYETSGNYTINLTVKNATASHAVNRTGYILVTNATIRSNVTILPTEIVITSASAPELRAPPYQDTGTLSETSAILSDVTNQESGDVIGTILGAIKRVIDHTTEGLITLGNNLPFFRGGGKST